MWFAITFVLATIFGFTYEVYDSVWVFALGCIFLGQASVLALLIIKKETNTDFAYHRKSKQKELQVQ